MQRSAQLGLGSAGPSPGLSFSALLPPSALLSIYSGFGTTLCIYLEDGQVTGKCLGWAKVGYSSVSGPRPPRQTGQGMGDSGRTFRKRLPCKSF